MTIFARRISLMAALSLPVLALAGCGGGSGGTKTGINAVLSSDALVFISTRDGNPEIYSMRSNGSAQTRLSVSAANESEPSRSRNGRIIVFVSDRDGDPEIYTMNANGAFVTQLTNNNVPDSSPTIASDNNTIAWISNGQVWTMVIDGTGAKQIPLSGGPAGTPVSVGWDKASGGFIVTLDTGAGSTVARYGPTGTFLNSFPASDAGEVRSSPDGQFFAVSDLNAGASPKRIFSVKISDGTSTALPALTGNAAGPTWNPNSQQIFWDAPQSDGKRQILAAIPGAATATVIGKTATGENFSPSWVD
jgi:Tol biopolymer transport system component